MDRTEFITQATIQMLGRIDIRQQALSDEVEQPTIAILAVELAEYAWNCLVQKGHIKGEFCTSRGTKNDQIENKVVRRE